MSNRALRTAASGLYAQQVNMEVISHNMANVNTTSFKKHRAEFQDLLYQQVQARPINSYLPGITEMPTQSVQVGTGVKLASTQKVQGQGDLQQTGNNLDVAIHGEGFFQLRQPDGTYAYTRDGAFKLSGDGSLVTSNGYVVEPGFTFDDNTQEMTISQDGVVSVRESGNTEFVEVGTIDLVKFVNAAGLEAIGDNMYRETEASGAPIIGTPGYDGFGTVNQGYLESSNVDIVDEMIAMITAQRSYEINSKTVQAVDDMMQQANNLKR